MHLVITVAHVIATIWRPSAVLPSDRNIKDNVQPVAPAIVAVAR